MKKVDNPKTVCFWFLFKKNSTFWNVIVTGDGGSDDTLGSFYLLIFKL